MRQLAFAAVLIVVIGCGTPTNPELEALRVENAELKKVKVIPPKEPTNSHVVRGTVRVGTTAISGGHVLLLNESGVGFTSPISDKGEYEFKSLASGKYILSVHTLTAKVPAMLPAQFSDVYGSRLEFQVDSEKPETIFDATLPVK